MQGKGKSLAKKGKPRDAERRTLLEASSAGLAVKARVGEPLDAHAVADLDGRALGMRADGDDMADALCANADVSDDVGADS